MKYIRTEDGFLLEVIRESESKKSYITKPNGWVIHKYRVIKQANTIEELCDEFVIKAYISSYPQIYHSVDLKELNEFREKDTIVYGAIWTDKGLIYVAKMNDKGELCLI